MSGVMDTFLDVRGNTYKGAIHHGLFYTENIVALPEKLIRVEDGNIFHVEEFISHEKLYIYSFDQFPGEYREDLENVRRLYIASTAIANECTPEADCSEMPDGADNVNHPEHYKTGKFECIDVMIETQGVEAVKDFCVCNAFKYLYRHGRKNGAEDIKKAIWYLNKWVELNDGAAERGS